MTGPATGYIGNAHYCYANTTAMLLASIGERVSPGLVEVLTGMGLGAAWLGGGELIFFSSSVPDLGITRALGLLGFEAVERAYGDDDPPALAELCAALASGPAILGPVDIGLLLYQPGKGRANGIDHFVLAYAMDDAEVHLHDPAGYPRVSLTLPDLVAAWRAEKVGYGRALLRGWSRTQSRSDGTMVDVDVIPRPGETGITPRPRWRAESVRSARSGQPATVTARRCRRRCRARSARPAPRAASPPTRPSQR